MAKAPGLCQVSRSLEVSSSGGLGYSRPKEFVVRPHWLRLCVWGHIFNVGMRRGSDARGQTTPVERDALSKRVRKFRPGGRDPGDLIVDVRDPL